MRFQADIATQPTAPEAGYVAIFPNGGGLPAPFPNGVVMDAQGRQVACASLWNNPQEGYAIVFANAPGPVWIYLESSPSPTNAWTEDSALHPSLLLYTRIGHATLNAARSLATESPPGQGVRMGLVPMIADAQNRFGPSDDFVSYYTGWLNFPESGSYFIGTISQDGSAVLIDGTTAAEWPGIHGAREGRTGDKGKTVSVTAGTHRVEYFQFTSEGSPMSQLIWRLPSAGKGALPQTPRRDAFAHSGAVRITAAETRSGVAPALFERRVRSYMSFADQFVDLFDLSIATPVSAGAQYNWQFTDGSQAHGPKVLWPIIRGANLSVTLTATNARGSSISTRLLYPDTYPPPADVNDPDARRDYAQALLNRLQGAPAGTSPVASWTPALWEMLPQVIQGGEAKDLLAFLFQHCNADLANLSQDDQKQLGDIYYEELKADKQGAPAILNTIIAAQKTPEAQFRWQLKALDFALFEAGDIAGARQIAAGLRVDTFHGGKNDAELKLIAQGDIERMAGNVDLATQAYTSAQALNQQPTRPGFLPFTGFNDRPSPTPSKDGIVISAADTQDADWRKRAVLQGTYYTEVKNLLDQNALADARDKLDAWALEFPLSKLGGDYTLAEAEYAIKFNDYERAQRILKAYRIRVDLSAQLAEIMQLEWDCDAHLQHPEETKSLAADIKKRFPDLPLAKEADGVLNP